MRGDMEFGTTVRDEGLRDAERFAAAAHTSPQDWNAALDFVLKKIDQNLLHFRDTFPAPASIGLVYPALPNTDWTSSFWTGMVWLAYERTGDPKYRESAEHQLASYRERVEKRIATETHDLGFLYTLSCVAAWRLTGNAEAKRVAILAADLLLERYLAVAGIIQAWGDLTDMAQRGRMIIDCCMNLPLLYWATEVTGDPAYASAARSHVVQSARYLVRPDASTYHTYFMDVATGAPRHGKTAQGYADDSCWARGQAWAIYGLALSYRYTRDPALLALGKKVANYFLNRLPEDGICCWDLVFTRGPEERDSSAAAITACGLLELAGHLAPADVLRRPYEQAARYMVRSLADHYTSASQPTSNGVLLHAVYNKPAKFGVDESTIWGDYYYMEALIRLTTDWKVYW